MSTSGYFILSATIAAILAIIAGRKRLVKHLSGFAIAALGLPIKELQEQVEGLQGMLSSKQDGMEEFLQFERFMAYIPVGVIVADVTEKKASRISYANEMAAGMLGYERKELLGLSISALVPEDKKQIQETAFRNAAVTQNFHRRPWPETALRKDGTRIIVEHSVNSWTDAQGTHFIAVIVAKTKS